MYRFPHGVVGNISACHADARGSIPRGEAFLVFWTSEHLTSELDAFFLKLGSTNLHSTVEIILVCHADARGSLPRMKCVYLLS